MTHVTCRLTAKNRDQLRNPTLCNQVWAINICLQALTKDISTPADIAPSTLETIIFYCFFLGGGLYKCTDLFILITCYWFSEDWPGWIGGPVSCLITHSSTHNGDDGCRGTRHSSGRSVTPSAFHVFELKQKARSADDGIAEILASDRFVTSWSPLTNVSVPFAGMCFSTVTRVMLNSDRPPDTTQTGPSCRVRRCELSRPDRQTSAFCVGVRPAVAPAVPATPGTLRS